MKFGLIIPAAGNASRFGANKAIEPRIHGFNFVETIIRLYENCGIRHAIIIGNQETISCLSESAVVMANQSKLVNNSNAHLGRLYSVVLGIGELENNSSVFLHDADRPYVKSETIRKLMNCNDASDYVIPSYKGVHGHPVRLNQSAIKTIAQQTDFTETLHDVLKGFSRSMVEVDDEGVLTNVNTQEDIL